MRLIDADVLNEDIERVFDGVCSYDVSPSTAVSDFQQIVDTQITIEAVPVVHGKWERTNITCEDGWALYRCTNCDWHTTYYYSFSASPTYNFCPNCGADMRRKEHIDEDTKLVIDEDGVMYRVVSKERALKAIDKWEKVVKERIEEMRGKEQI